MTSISHADISSYYRGARVALQFVETRRAVGQRFGTAADARWRAFAGSPSEASLTAAARLDLLIRDADAEWPGALGARTVFALSQVAEDEAFGPEWVGLDGAYAEELWREPLPPAASAEEAFESLAGLWKLALSSQTLPPIDAADSILAAGPSAFAALATLFAARKDLDWAAQVTCVATLPAHRQLAGLAAVVAEATNAASVVSASEVADSRSPGMKRVVSDDASPEDRAAVLAGG